MYIVKEDDRVLAIAESKEQLLRVLQADFASTTEDASQTVRGDEQPCEDGLVQSPDNAVTGEEPR